MTLRGQTSKRFEQRSRRRKQVASSPSPLFFIVGALVASFALVSCFRDAPKKTDAVKDDTYELPFSTAPRPRGKPLSKESAKLESFISQKEIARRDAVDKKLIEQGSATRTKIMNNMPKGEMKLALSIMERSSKDPKSVSQAEYMKLRKILSEPKMVKALSEWNSYALSVYRESGNDWKELSLSQKKFLGSNGPAMLTDSQFKEERLKKARGKLK